MEQKIYEQPMCMVALWEKDVITLSDSYLEGEGEKDIFG